MAAMDLGAYLKVGMDPLRLVLHPSYLLARRAPVFKGLWE